VAAWHAVSEPGALEGRQGDDGAAAGETAAARRQGRGRLCLGGTWWARGRGGAARRPGAQPRAGAGPRGAGNVARHALAQERGEEPVPSKQREAREMEKRGPLLKTPEAAHKARRGLPSFPVRCNEMREKKMHRPAQHAVADRQDMVDRGKTREQTCVRERERTSSNSSAFTPSITPLY